MASEKVNIVIKAVDKTKRSFRAVTMGLNAIKKVAFSMQSALVAVGVAGFGFLVKKSLNATDALGKMADKIGIGTAELGGLRHAAELTGVATNTLDMGLQRMVRRVSEAASGSGEAKDALIELGLSAKALNAMAPDEQFRAIADAMEGVAGQGEKVRLAMRLFDTEGVALVNTLKGGSAALIEMEQEAERLGLRLSRGLVKGVEKANDSITVLGSYIANVFHRAVGELAPVIEAVTVKLREWMEASIQAAGGPKEFAKSVAVAFLDAGKAVVAVTASMLNSVIAVANKAGQAVQALLDLLPSDDKPLSSLNKDLAQYEKSLNNVLDSENKTVRNRQAKITAYSREIELLKEQIELGMHAAAFEPITPFKFQDALDQLDALKAGINSIPVSDDKKLGGTGTTLVDLTAMTNSQLIDLQDGYQAMAEGKKIDHQRRMMELTHQYLAKQSAMQKAAAAGDIDTLQESGIKVVGALKGQYKWAFDLHKTFAIKDALIDTYKAVSTAMASAPPPLNYGLAAVALAQGVANVQMLRSTSFREKGGPITAGQPYIVGERGPELIVPNQAANVVPNDQMGGNNITFNIQANDTRGFDQLLQQRRGQIIGMVNQAMNDRGQRAIA
jgi:hypothetical protein